MTHTDEMRWLTWAREIQSLCQTGLAFTKSDYETKRYERLIEIAAEITADHTNREREALKSIFLKQPGYATPKVDVRAAVLREGKILLVQETADRCWAMPGGWADVGDVPSDAAIREVREESGFLVEAKKVIGVYDANRGGRPLEFFHAFKIVFLCEILGGEATPSDETLAVEFFDFDSLPPLSVNRTHERHLADVRVHAGDPGRATDFD